MNRYSAVIAGLILMTPGLWVPVFGREALKTNRLLFPWVANRDGLFASELSLNNLSADTAFVTLTARRASGERAQAVRRIPPWGMLVERADSLFPSLGSGSGFAVLAISTACDLQGAWVVESQAAASGASPAQGAAVALARADRISGRAGRELYFGWLPTNETLISAVALANLEDQPARATLRFLDETGAEVARHELEGLETFTPFAATVNDLAPADAGDVHLLVSADRMLTGAAFVFNVAFREAAIGNAVNVEPAALGDQPARLTYPWISNRAGQFESMIIAANLDDAPLEATLTARRAGGPQAQATRVIQPGGFLRESATSLFPGLGDGPGFTVSLTAPSPSLAGVWITNSLAAASGASPSLGVAVPEPPFACERSGPDLLFSFLPRGGTRRSAPVMVPSGAEPATIDLRFGEPSGRRLAQAAIPDAPPGEPVVIAPDDLPEGNGPLYMLARSGGPALAGAAFVFDEVFNEPAIANATAVDLTRGGDSLPEQPLFREATDRIQSNSLSIFSMDAEHADLDGDGDLDIIVAGEFTGNLLLINDGSGRFRDESVTRLPFTRRDSEDIAVADFDLDGDLDFVIVSEDDQVNEVFINDGSGVFVEEGVRLPTLGISNAVLAADLNGDGAPDLLIGNNGQNRAMINNGGGVFVDQTGQRLPVQNDITQDLELGDVDGDGDLDLLVGNEDRNRLLINDGAGAFRDESTQRLSYRNGSEETREADFGDVDGDGDLDVLFTNTALFAASNDAADNRLLINNGSGFFSDETAARLPADGDVGLDGDFVDVDRDGDLDILTANVTPAQSGLAPAPYRVYLNDGAGVFTERTGLVFPAGVLGRGLDVEAGDFNGDGLIDLYLCSRGGSDRLLLGVR